MKYAISFLIFVFCGFAFAKETKEVKRKIACESCAAIAAIGPRVPNCATQGTAEETVIRYRANLALAEELRVLLSSVKKATENPDFQNVVDATLNLLADLNQCDSQGEIFLRLSDFLDNNRVLVSASITRLEAANPTRAAKFAALRRMIDAYYFSLENGNG